MNDTKCEKCVKEMAEKEGRFGKFLACTGFPECKNTKNINEDGSIKSKEEEEKTKEVCDKCGSPMVKKHGRYGPFLACSNYPACKNIKGLEKGTGVACPQCGKGEIVQKRSRFGKFFFACNQYPDCKFALWTKPTGNKCPKCSALMVFAKEGMEECSSKDCKHKQELEDK